MYELVQILGSKCDKSREPVAFPFTSMGWLNYVPFDMKWLCPLFGRSNYVPSYEVNSQTTLLFFIQDYVTCINFEYCSNWKLKVKFFLGSECWTKKERNNQWICYIDLYTVVWFNVLGHFDYE